MRAAFRRSPSSFARFMAELRKVLLNSSGDISGIVSASSVKIVSCGENSLMAVGDTQLFNGHTLWHMSHPYRQLAVFVPSGNGPRCSIVRYDMHLDAFMWLSVVMALPGHASMHRRHSAGH